MKTVKMMIGTLMIVVVLTLAMLGGVGIWEEHIVKDYDSYLTEKVYSDLVLSKNANLVFYKLGCPYCQVGKQAVVTAAEDSLYPTFFVDVETAEGQALVQFYQVEKAASIIQIRDGQGKLFIYAKDGKDDEIEVDESAIKEALND